MPREPITLALDPSDVQRTPHRCGRVWYSDFCPRVMIGSIADPYWQAVLDRPMTFYLDGTSVTLPAGFIWDGASIRYRAVNAVIPRWGWRVSMGSGPHDGLFTDLRHLIPDQDNPRLWADTLLFDFWRASGVNWARSRAGYRAVRLFGGAVWDRGTELGFADPQTTKGQLVAAGRAGVWLTDKQRSAA